MIRRVVLVVLDGLRPDAIERFDLVHLKRLMATGASTRAATTVAPSITTAAITSLLTGVSPTRHGVTSDRVFIPGGSSSIVPVPERLARHGLPSYGFMADVPTLLRGVANRVGRRLGFSATRFSGKSAPEILMAARATLRAQRRGLFFLHWPDADRAGHARGWMSPAYEEAAHSLDGSLGMLHALAEVGHDPGTLLIALADHGGGGFVANDHNSDHPLDRTIPILLSGAMVTRQTLAPAHLLDIPATVLWALGVNVADEVEGRPLVEAFDAYVDVTAATPAVA